MVGFWDAGSPRGIERILKTANPESLQIGHLTRLDVGVNLKSAQDLASKFHRRSSRADRVIK